MSGLMLPTHQMRLGGSSMSTPGNVMVVSFAPAHERAVDVDPVVTISAEHDTLAVEND